MVAIRTALADQPCGVRIVQNMLMMLISDQTTTAMYSAMIAHPDEVADWLEDYGITASEVETAIFLRGGETRRRYR